MRVVVLYDPGAEDWTAEDVAGVMQAVDDIARIFVSLNHQVQRVPVRHDMRWFNVCRRADLPEGRSLLRYDAVVDLTDDVDPSWPAAPAGSCS